MHFHSLIPSRFTAWLIVAVSVNLGVAAADPSSPKRGRRLSPVPAATGEENSATAEIAGLNSDLLQLTQELAELARQAGSLRSLALDIEFAGVDLTGGWQLTLPAGFEYPAEISRTADGRLEVDVRGVMRGTYRQDGRLIRVEIPSDERLTEFVWECVSPDQLVLIESPPVAKIGSDYRGATLKRLQK